MAADYKPDTPTPPPTAIEHFRTALARGIELLPAAGQERSGQRHAYGILRVA